MGTFLLLGAGAVLADAYFQAYHAYQEIRGVVPSLTSARGYLAKGEVPPGDPLDRASGLATSAQGKLDHARVSLRTAGAIPFFTISVTSCALWPW